MLTQGSLGNLGNNTAGWEKGGLGWQSETTSCSATIISQEIRGKSLNLLNTSVLILKLEEGGKCTLLLPEW